MPATTHNGQSERRRESRSLRDNFDLLDEPQLDAVYALMKVGAQLLFVRNAVYCPLAILSHDGNYITVDASGEIDLHPAIHIRTH
ncbi:hypothetical protein [Gallaecimonas sp. GXIMD4217]|uniref:hypothetical protein n=1 Tax=Gallaecimonas sp. GXIMD4217 TaxID=3131927 RepID=UPI00311B0718